VAPKLNIIVLLLCCACSKPAQNAAQPIAPSNLVAAQLEPGQIRLGWKDNSSDEANFIVQRGTAPSGTFGKIAVLAPNTTGYTDPKPGQTGNTVYYRVQAVNAQGFGPFTNTVEIIIGATPTASPTASPTPSPTGTPTPSQTPTPTASPSPSPTPSTTPVPPTPSPTATPTPTVTPSPSPTPTPTATPVQTRTVTVVIVDPTPGHTYEIYCNGAMVAVLNGADEVGVPNLVVGQTYQFANRVLDANRIPSPMSSPVSYTVTAATTQQLDIEHP